MGILSRVTRAQKSGSGLQMHDEGVKLAAQADAEGCVEESCGEGRGGGDQADQGRAGAESGNADDGEDQAHQLGELQRRHRFTLADRSQPRGHDVGEHQSVGIPAGTASGADREDDGLQSQNDRGGRRADADTTRVITRTTVVSQATNRGPRTSTWSMVLCST